MKLSFFFANSDIVVIGTHPEAADYDNPNGFIFAISSYVYAEYEDGTRVRKHVKTNKNEQEAMGSAEKMAEALNVRLANGKLPVAFNTWESTFPCYGSDAHNEDDIIEWERSLEY